MPDFAHRTEEDEWMDGADVPQAEFAACMHDLATVNALTLARRPTLAFIDEALKAAPDRVLSVLDVGYGEGDMLRAVAALCAKRGRDVRLVGIDLNPRSEPVARATTPPGMTIEFLTGDAYALAADEPFDVVISSLVTHHMSDPEVMRFLSWMDASTRMGWLVNDLHRHWFAYYGFAALAWAMRWHPFVRHDGPLSIARAFTRADWEQRLARAGIIGARIAWWFPFRYCVEQRKW